MRPLSGGVLMFLITLISVGCSSADEPSAVSGTIVGKVSDASGSPLEDVVIEVDPPPPEDLAVTTTEAGRYRWHLPPGDYVVTARASEFALQSKQAIVGSSERTQCDFVLAEKDTSESQNAEACR